MLKLFLTIFALVGLTIGQGGDFCFNLDECCQGLEDTTSLGNWDNCTIYYLCFGSIPYPYACPGGGDKPDYNPVTKVCDSNVEGCIGGTRAPEEPTVTMPTSMPTSTGPSIDGNCTEEGSYFVPYPGDCQKYMVCASGILLPVVESCPPGTLFDPDLKQCNIESVVQCKPTCPGMDTISLPHDRNCSLYWLCTLGEASLKSCPLGLVFDTKFRTCNVEDAVFCPNLCPEEGTVNLPNQKNCSLYWLCTLGLPTLKNCPENLLFDPSLGQCNLASAVDCNGDKGQQYYSKDFWSQGEQTYSNGDIGNDFWSTEELDDDDLDFEEDFRDNENVKTNSEFPVKKHFNKKNA